MSQTTSIDILAFGAHPDDVELSISGTLIKHRNQGHSIGIVDLTRGELGTRGHADLRDQEAESASKALGLSIRRNLRLADGFFDRTEENLRQIIGVIREFRPKVVLYPAPYDRHPDHARASSMIKEACFYAGLPKIETTGLQAWRPHAFYAYVQDRFIKPTFVVDISGLWEEKIRVIQCYKSQFFDAESKEPITPISGPDFLAFLEARALQMGREAGFMMGEGFISERVVGVDSLFQLK
ncbi:MAG: bacillithiol biosynthesis deacetylase BshB1 [Flavobacteriales bacterium]